MRVVLVFDGSSAVRARMSRSDSNIEIVYATGGRKADGWILDRAERLSNERVSVLVITEDRGIKNALPAKVRTMTVKAFWNSIGAKDKGEPGEKPAPPLDDVEAYFLEAERRMMEARRKK